jgi:hypothetical protein
MCDKPNGIASLTAQRAVYAIVFVILAGTLACPRRDRLVHSPFIKLVKKYLKASVHYDKASSDKFSSL